jgi:hypothetical protein
MKKKATTNSVDKVYKLRNGMSPLSYTLPSRSTKRYPLMYFDEENNVNRSLRYARNQKTPFEDEQDGNAIIEPVVFEDGLLHVPKQNPVLQYFLYYHPLNGVVFEEVNNEKDAEEEMEAINYEVDALIEARNMSLDHLEMTFRVLFGKDPSKYSVAEIKRDVLMYSKNHPRNFLDVINDPLLKLEANVHKFFSSSILVFKNGTKEVWFNTTSNKKKLMNIPFDTDPYMAVTMHLQTDEGIEALKLLEANI